METESLFADPVSASGGEPQLQPLRHLDLPEINYRCSRTEESRRVMLVKTV